MSKPVAVTLVSPSTSIAVPVAWEIAAGDHRQVVRRGDVTQLQRVGIGDLDGIGTGGVRRHRTGEIVSGVRERDLAARAAVERGRAGGGLLRDRSRLRDADGRHGERAGAEGRGPEFDRTLVTDRHVVGAPEVVIDTNPWKSLSASSSVTAPPKETNVPHCRRP